MKNEALKKPNKITYEVLWKANRLKKKFFIGVE